MRNAAIQRKLLYLASSFCQKIIDKKCGLVAQLVYSKICPYVRTNFGRPVQNLFFMQFFVYILLSLKDNGLYVGQTGDIQDRLHEHNAGKVNSTKARRPFIVLHQESYPTRAEAMKREKFLKSLYSAKFKQKLVKEYLKKNKFWNRVRASL